MNPSLPLGHDNLTLTMMYIGKFQKEPDSLRVYFGSGPKLFWIHSLLRKLPKKIMLEQINNCTAKWRLGDWDILELPWLAASSKMEVTTMAGKAWRTSHEPPRPCKDRHLSHW